MDIRTEKEYYDRFVSNSVILNQERCAGPGQLPNSSKGLYDIGALKRYLHQLNRTDEENGIPVGEIAFAKYKFNEAKADWELFCRQTMAVPFKSYDDDTGNVQLVENIHKWKAKVEMLFSESRALVKKIEKTEAEELEHQKGTGYFDRRGNCFRKDHEVVECDGRAVSDGKFLDTGEDLLEYIEIIKGELREKAKRQRQKVKRNFEKYAQSPPL